MSFKFRRRFPLAQLQWRLSSWQLPKLLTFRYSWKFRQMSALRQASFVVKLFCAYQLFSEYVGGLRQVAGPSMLPTFSTETEWILEDSLSIRLFSRPISRGEVLVFNSPRQPFAQICKRVIGLPGDIVCVDPTGVRKNGRWKDEYVKVPEGHVWIAGDNATASRDSRDYGPVPIGLVHSRVVLKFWPWRTRKIFRDDTMLLHEPL